MMAVIKQDLLKSIKSLAPPLSYDLHKGQAGRIGIVGGSIEYTGAPYFAAISAMKVGADLAHVFCPAEAASVIKSYSPELIVHPLQSEYQSLDQIKSWFPRLHSVVIGPGMGRNKKLMISTVEALLKEAKNDQKDIIIDADGLFLITEKPHLIQNYTNSVLTPNKIEFDRLYHKMLGHIPAGTEEAKEEETRTLAQSMGGVTILRKGYRDIISNGSQVLVCEEEGSPRRQGGQGDLLSGSLGVFMHWSRITKPTHEYSPSLLASYASCTLTKRCAKVTYDKLGRSMLTSDMVNNIGSVASELFQ